jgi:hypothetical protein
MPGNLVLRGALTNVLQQVQELTNFDWASRAQGAQVIWATKFDTQAEVDNWRWTNQNGTGWDPNSTQSRSTLLQWRQGEGINGGNALRIEDTTTSGEDNPVTWWRTLDNTKTSGNSANTYVVPPGTPIYLQVRVKANAARMNNTTGTGLKIAEITTASDTNVNQEVFVARQFGRTFPQVVGATSTQSDPFDNVDLGGGNFDLQPGSDYGFCAYPGPAGCWTISADEWVTYHLKVIGGTVDQENTVVTLEVARQTESSYTTIYDRSDNRIPTAYEGANGYSAIALFNRNEDHTGLPAGCYHYFTEVIASLAPIPCPTATPAPASWFSGLTSSQWVDGNAQGIVTNKIRNVAYAIEAGYGDPDGITAAWSGGTMDYDRARLLVTGGGHADYSGNEIYGLTLTSTTCAWNRVVDAQVSGSLTGAFDTQAGYGDGTFLGTKPSASHTYNRPTYGNNRLWLAGVDSQSTSSGEWSTATYAYDFGNSRWEYYGEGIVDHQTNGFGKWLGGHAIYDRNHNRVYSMAQLGTGTHLFFGKDATNQTQNNFIAQSFSFTADDYKWGVCAPDLDLWIWGSVNNNNGHRVVTGTLSNLNGFTVRTTSGASTTIGLGTGAVYHRAARKVYLYNHNFGNGDILVIDIPNPVSGTWNFRLVSIGGVNPQVSFAGDNDTISAGPFGRFNGIEWTDGQMLLTLVTHIDSSTYLMRVPAAGL